MFQNVPFNLKYLILALIFLSLFKKIFTNYGYIFIFFKYVDIYTYKLWISKCTNRGYMYTFFNDLKKVV